ncbi:MAG: protease modulator HflC [Candidatus Eisenbacteria bacterium]|uniref:Protein HflC n=1 Tax=Eiseniibacteriota bacterium TaxID=2212470 RepID=A0A948RRZ9_UNCEI|nr:protease modulator HflC [Candidatus Eisenbacteria bacterium]MBU1948127.1 protease modulator HflC [Candidatus Eisenbacteria bacterium]MBU2689790.1 protease modulator HflC [Candidatus Eisenbacteria bacterium]
MKPTLIALAILGVAVLVLLNSAFFIVGEAEQAIITQFGKPLDRQITTPGLKMKVPFIQKAHRFDKRFLEWDGDANELPTRDKRFIWVDAYARWRITDPLLYFQRLKDERGAQTRLDDILDGETRNAIANHLLLELVRSTNRTESDSLIFDDEQKTALENIAIGRDQIRLQILQNAAARTSDLGIEILDFQFKRINYVDEVSRKVYERMIAERERIADRYRSEGEGEAFRIRGNKERDLKAIQSDAYRQAEVIIGRADSTAAQIYANAYNQNGQTRDFYSFLKTMESYRNTIDPETWLILSTGGEFYKYLKSMDGR